MIAKQTHNYDNVYDHIAQQRTLMRSLTKSYKSLSVQQSRQCNSSSPTQSAEVYVVQTIDYTCL